jgi:acyl-CoA thioester hydrolase
VYKILIREHHLDTFGHVNNATYLELYEEARWELITNKGFGLSKVQETGLGPVILEVNLRFIKEISLREEITIDTKMLEYKGKIGRLEQTMFNEKKEILSSAVFTFGLFDTKARKLINPTDEWKNALSV